MRTVSTEQSLRAIIIIMILCGSLLGGAYTVKQDSWIAILMMLVFNLPLLLLAGRLGSLSHGKNFFTFILDLLGPIGGRIASFLLVIYAVFVLGFMLRHFTEFIAVISLDKTPRTILILLLLLPTIYIASGGEKIICRWAKVVCVLIIANIVFTIICAGSILDPNNIFPILEYSLFDISADSIPIGTIILGESAFAILIGFSKEMKEKNTAYKVLLPGAIIGIFFLAVVMMRNIMILGPELEREAKFSIYMAVRIIEIGSFFERMESLISFMLVLLSFTKMAVFLFVAADGAAKIMKSKSTNHMLLPVSLLGFAVGVTVFKNAFETFEYIQVFGTISMPLQIAILLIIWIAAEIKRKKDAKALVSH